MSAVAESGSPQPGLRERKQAETKARIERIALRAFHENGYEAVSVDSICEQAEISQRTFFNYYGSKENVVLGDRLPNITAERLAEFGEETDLDVLDAMLVLASEAARSTTADPEIRALRQEIFVANPQLMRAVFARMEGLQRTVLSALIGRLARDRSVSIDDPAVVEDARMMVAITGSVIRFATDDWSDRSTNPDGVTAPDAATVADQNSAASLAWAGNQQALLAVLRRARVVAAGIISPPHESLAP